LYFHHNNWFPTPHRVQSQQKRKLIKKFDFSRFQLEKKYPDIKVFLGSALAHCIIFSAQHLKRLAAMKVIIKGQESRNLDYILHCQARQYDFYTTKPMLSTQFLSFSDIVNVTVKRGFG
jgi:hypothetical protein